jgi:hypothetical protein
MELTPPPRQAFEVVEAQSELCDTGDENQRPCCGVKHNPRAPAANDGAHIFRKIT